MPAARAVAAGAQEGRSPRQNHHGTSDRRIPKSTVPVDLEKEQVMPKLLKDTFKAWIDKMPGPTAYKLIVTGDIEVPTAGWKATLVRTEPQGINPDILLLDVRAEKPDGHVIQVTQIISLRYEESPPKANYSQVTVFDGKDSVTVEVKTVQ